MIRYVAEHWRGRQRLGWSFWVNFIVLTLALRGLYAVWLPRHAENPRGAFVLTLCYFAIWGLLIFPWQAVGVLRSSERTVRERAGVMAPRLAQAAVLLGFAIVLVDALGVVFAFREWAAADTHLLPARPIAPEIAARSGEICLDGWLEHGTTRRLILALAAHPDVERIVLNSAGGQVVEGRGVARVVRGRGLTTVVLGECSSACVNAFIAGERRWVGPSARIGFHRYRLEHPNVLPHIDLTAEMERDFRFYASQGVDAARLREAFQTEATRIWYPSAQLLGETSVTHHRLSEAEIERIACSSPPPGASEEQGEDKDH